MGMAKKTGEKKKKGGGGLPNQKSKTDAGTGDDDNYGMLEPSPSFPSKR